MWMPNCMPAVVLVATAHANYCVIVLATGRTSREQTPMAKSHRTSFK
jgi:hypothetical protein